MAASIHNFHHGLRTGIGGAAGNGVVGCLGGASTGLGLTARLSLMPSGRGLEIV